MERVRRAELLKKYAFGPITVAERKELDSEVMRDEWLDQAVWEIDLILSRFRPTARNRRSERATKALVARIVDTTEVSGWPLRTHWFSEVLRFNPDLPKELAGSVGSH